MSEQASENVGKPSTLVFWQEPVAPPKVLGYGLDFHEQLLQGCSGPGAATCAPPFGIIRAL